MLRGRNKGKKVGRISKPGHRKLLSIIKIIVSKTTEIYCSFIISFKCSVRPI